jgi:BASS family bile acid:Na+ symporter
MGIQEIFKIVVVVFTVTNLMALGLASTLREAVRTLGSPRFIILTIVWGWVVGPALAWLITWAIPMEAPYAAGLMLISLAPAAPFYPMMVRRARGDMDFAAAFILLATVCTVVLLPLMLPLLVRGLKVSTWALARPLLMTVLLPLIAGIAIKVSAPKTAKKLLPVIRRIGVLSLLITAVMTFMLYWREMLGAVGSFAIAAQIIFFTVMATVTYKIGFRLKQRQRSAMSLGMCTRNIAAVFVAYFGIQDPDPKIFVMMVLVVPLALIVALISARIFARQGNRKDIQLTLD